MTKRELSELWRFVERMHDAYPADLGEEDEHDDFKAAFEGLVAFLQTKSATRGKRESKMGRHELPVVKS